MVINLHQNGATPILKKIKSYNIDFVVVGGFAKYLHGIEESFRDLDLFISKDLNSSENIIRFLESFNTDIKQFTYEFNDIIRLRVDGFQIDFLPKLHGLEDDKVNENKIIKNYGSEIIKVLSLSDLKTNIETVNQLISAT